MLCRGALRVRAVPLGTSACLYDSYHRLTATDKTSTGKCPLLLPHPVDGTSRPSDVRRSDTRGVIDEHIEIREAPELIWDMRSRATIFVAGAHGMSSFGSFKFTSANHFEMLTGEDLCATDLRVRVKIIGR